MSIRRHNGIQRQSDSCIGYLFTYSFFQQDLRRAFKKLALEKHPDKNPDNPNAHDEFVKINTAFEVGYMGIIDLFDIRLLNGKDACRSTNSRII